LGCGRRLPRGAAKGRRGRQLRARSCPLRCVGPGYLHVSTFKSHQCPLTKSEISDLAGATWREADMRRKGGDLKPVPAHPRPAGTNTMTRCTVEDCVEVLSCIDNMRCTDASSFSPPHPLVDDLDMSLQRMRPTFMDPIFLPSAASKRKWPFRRTSVPKRRTAKTPTRNVQSRNLAEETSDHASPTGSRIDAADDALPPTQSLSEHTATWPASPQTTRVRWAAGPTPQTMLSHPRSLLQDTLRSGLHHPGAKALTFHDLI
jgi:hypothetical protein